jgi:hypothetical protein
MVVGYGQVEKTIKGMAISRTQGFTGGLIRFSKELSQKDYKLTTFAVIEPVATLTI